MALMSVEEWRRQKAAKANTHKPTSPVSSPGTAKNSADKTSDLMSVAEWREKKASESVQGWGKAANALLRDTDTYFQTWSSREDPDYQALSDRSDRLLVQAGDWRRQYAGNREAIEYIDSVVKALSDAKQSYGQYFDYYGQWGSREEYDTYQANDAMVKLDLDSYEKELAKILDQQKAEGRKSILDSMINLAGESAVTGAPKAAAIQDATKAVSGYNANRYKTAAKQQYLNQARYLQGKAALADVTGNADFRQYSADNRGIEELTRRWEQRKVEPGQNGYLAGNAADTGSPAAAAQQGGEISSYSSYDDLKYMSEDEAAIYNYYYAKEGKEKAEEYLYSIREELNRRVAEEIFAGLKGKTAKELAFGVPVGIDQFASGQRTLVEGFTEEQNYSPMSARQIASGMVREDLKEAGPKLPEWLGGGSLGQAGYDLITTTANMAPSILTSLAVGIVNPAAGSAIGSGLMGASAAGGAYQEALNQGFSQAEARGYGLLVGASEIAMEKVLGGISALGGNALGKTVVKNLDNACDALKWIAKVTGGAVSEFSEEYLQEVLTPLYRNILLGTGEEVQLFSAEALYSGILGALSGGMFEGVGTSMELSTENRNIREVYGADPQALVTEALALDPDNSFAQKMQQRLDDKKQLTGGQMKKLMRMNDGVPSTMEADAEEETEAASDRDTADREVAVPTAARIPESRKMETQENTVPAATAEESQAVDTGYRVAEDGKAAKIASVSATDGRGGMQLKLEDGSVVDAAEVGYASEGEAVLYEAVAKLGADEEISNILIDTYRKDPGGVSAEEYAAGMLEAFSCGRYNIPRQQMAENRDVMVLTEMQRNGAYELGRVFGKDLVQSRQANAQRAKVIAKTKQVKQKAGEKTLGRKPKVHFERQGRKLSGVQETALTQMEQLSVLLGTEFQIYESYTNEDGARVYMDENGEEKTAPNGWYDPGTGTVHVDLNAGAGGEGTIAFTVAHELTHFIWQWSPEKFDLLAETVFSTVYAEKEIPVMDLIREQQHKAERSGRELSLEEAYEEAVADAMEGILTSGNVVQMMVEVKQRDVSLWEKIREWFQDLAEDIKKLVKAYEKYKPDSKEGRAVASMKEMLPIIEGYYADALLEASENYQAAEGQKNTTPEGGNMVQYSIRKNVMDVDGNVYDDVIELEYRIFNKIRRSSKAYINFLRSNLINKKITVYDDNGDPEIIEFAKDNERVRKDGTSSFRRVLGELERAQGDVKKLIIINAEEVTEISEIRNHSEENSHQWLDQNGWDERWSYVMTQDGTIFPVILHIAKTRDGRNLLYSVNVDITKGIGIDIGATFAPTNRQVQQAVKVPTPSDGIVTQGKSEVKKKLSARDPLQEKTISALEKQNAKLSEDVQQLKELVKLQGTLTGGKLLKASSVEAAARMLKKRADSKGNTKELAGLLTGFYDYILQGEELTWEGVKEAAEPAAAWLLENRKQYRDAYAQEILTDLKGRSISLNESQKAEAASYQGSYSGYRKMLFGSVKLTKDGLPLDDAWQELSSLYPGVFDKDMNANDMPEALAVIIDRLKNTREDAFAYSEDEFLASMIREVYDSYWNVSTLYTVADKKQKQIDLLKGQHYEQMQQLKQEHRNSMANIRDNRNKADYRRKIRKVIRDLDKILNRGDKKRNVKEGMQDFASGALTAFETLFTDRYSEEDMVRNGVGTDLTPDEQRWLREAQEALDQLENLPGGYEGYLQRQELEPKLKSKLHYRMNKLKDVFIRERARLKRTQVSEVLGKLADSYRALEASEDAYIQQAYHENVYQYLLMLKEDVGGTTVKDMTLGQLEELYQGFTMVMTTVRKANRMFAENLKENRDVLAQRVIREVQTVGGKGKLRTEAGEKANTFSWNNEKPVYAFERIGSDTFTTLFNNIRKGQDGWAVDLQEADAFRRGLYAKYNHSKWDYEKEHSFTSSSGLKFTLNLEQIMSLYAYSKREQAYDHLMKGGFVFDGKTEMVVSKKGFKRTYLKKDATAYNLSPELLEEIISLLTPEQKAFADEMQSYLSDTMGEKGNEVSMQLYGIKLFKEKFYFPLRSAGQYMERAKETDLKKEQGQISIVNSGFAKATKINASNPVVLSGFMQTWAEHVNEMSMYHSFVLPMEDFRRVYNFSSPHVEEQGSVSVNSVLQNVYGEACVKYIDQLYRDLNGGALVDNTTGIINKLMNLFKKGAVFASASVTIQQGSAVARAAALVDVKHFIGPKVDKKRHKALWDEVKKYAPVAFIKEMGYFDTNMGRSAVDLLTAEEYQGFAENALAMIKDEDHRDEFLSKGPALADELTWCVIWDAVKRETKARNPKLDPRSEEFLKLAGERFSEVIDKTQVYDSVLSRSANMRSKDTGMKMATAFMAEPTTSINMIEDALRKGKRGDRRYCRRAIGAVLASVLLNSALKSLVYAARDDDEEKTYAEKYVGALTGSLVDGINPATYIPFIKDIMSIVQGYDVERSDMAVISDIWNAVQKLTNDDVSLYSKVEAIGGSVAQLFGLPVKNIMRDLRSVYQVFDTVKNGEKATGAGFLYAMQEAVTGKAVPNAQQLYEAKVAADASHTARVTARYDDADSANAAVRSVIRDLFLEDEITTQEALRQLVLYSGMDGSEAHWTMDAWEYRKETGSSEDYGKYNDFYEAVQTGENLDAVIKEYLDNGVEKETLSQQITTYFKPRFLDMTVSEQVEAEKYLIDGIIALGYERDQVEERILYWEFESDNGYDYTNRKEAYFDGEVSAEALRKAMMDFGGMTEKEADDELRAYNWLKDNQEQKFTVDEAKAYTKPIEELGYSVQEAGISPEIFLDCKKQWSTCKGVDSNGDGRADKDSIKNQKLDVIHNMDLTDEQKDVLYFANGWAKSKLKGAPWH